MSLKSQQVGNIYKNANSNSNTFRKAMKKGANRKRCYAKFSEDARTKAYTCGWAD